MNILRLVFELLVIYLLYKFIFDFIIPVYNSTKNMKQHINKMHEKMQQMQEKDNASTSHPSQEKTVLSKEDYIDFEEIK